ncbi:hypothetical protein Q2T42_28140 [Leptolyngbya boryana CZ1]|uniref:Uncharacterized protein n=1 Tax=Leptolyngbya boryana CZ1 TaxID=3060204 RepID=A0AA96WU85_LEPBY|nr:hypothetical protein [Leptolyngbya boryana]WNZ45662.1 hypothetical protein Q2T42_28140 [Leptolyngbya boryana CZ1]
MPRQYTIPQRPELLIRVSSSDPDKARYKATQELVRLINEEPLGIQIPEGFSTRQLIEIVGKDLMAEGEDKVIEAVKVLSKLSAAKQKVQELHEQAIEARQQADALFENRKISVEEFQRIEEGLKVIKEFAQANLRYKEALPDAENARSLIDKALEPPELS